MSYVMLIPGWFPSRKSFLAGDFIERHAKAAAAHFPVKVLFVVKDNDLPFGRVETVHQRHSENYETMVVYYSARHRLALVEKLFSAWMQARCLKQGFRQLVQVAGLPALLHAHVLVKHAWFALRMSARYHIPLLASEQWTGYLPEAAQEFAALPAFRRRVIGKVFAAAVHVTVVSDYLGKQLRSRYGIGAYTVIPNLVDMAVFQPMDPAPGGPARFIHVSTLSYQKNVDEMLQACAQLAKEGMKFELLVVSPPHPGYTQKIRDLGLDTFVRFSQELPQAALRQLVATSDALILYSNYETFGCVVVEANACGVPVIVSDHPVFRENVAQGVTGFRVPLHAPDQLAASMKKIIHNTHRFSREAIIQRTRNHYSAEVVGQQFAEVYRRYAKP